jgi:hypothetical protein
VIEFHSVPCTARAELQDIELAWISQEVTERFYNLYSVRCPLWVISRHDAILEPCLLCPRKQTLLGAIGMSA